MSLRNYVLSARIYEGRLNGVIVSKACHTASKTEVVIKEQTHNSLQEANASIAEALNQTNISHPAVVQIYECFLDMTPEGRVKSVIVEELMETDLAEEITRRRAYLQYWTEYELLFHLQTLSEALLHAQTRNIAHRDIKPQNVFVSKGRFKLGDFGSATRDIGDAIKHRTLQGTPFYLSPELKVRYTMMISGNTEPFFYDPYQSDVYSLGVTLLYMALLQHPTSLSNLEELEKATAGYLDSISYLPILRYFLQAMLQIDPRNRATFAQIVEYLKGVTSQDYIKPQATEPAAQPDKTTTDTTTVDDIARCVQCNGFLGSNLWHSSVPAKYEEYNQLFPTVCSLNCLRSYVEGLKLSEDNCMFDFKDISHAGLRLECLHGFCHIGCLTLYLRKSVTQPSKDISLICQICHKQTSESYLVSMYENKEKLMHEVFPSKNSLRDRCQGCSVRSADRQMECGHRLCLDCMTSIPAPKGRAICSFCGKSSDSTRPS